jgi:Transglycosylase SLT domain
MNKLFAVAVSATLFLLLFTEQAAAQKNTSQDTVQLPYLIDTIAPAFPNLAGQLETIHYIQFPSLLKGHEEFAISYVADFSKKRRDYLIRTYKRDQKFSKKIVPVLGRYNVPRELRVLIALESGYNPNALSGAGAFGYWQFMDAPAREYGLTIIDNEERKAEKDNKKTTVQKNTPKQKVKKRDDRANLMRSTTAAAKYLRDRRKNLNNDWLLIVASYNYGVGNVWEAMRACGKPNPTFWDIKHLLPAETRNYVMNFIALNVIFYNYDSFVKNELVFEKAPEVNTEASITQTGTVLTTKTLEENK